MTDDRGHLVEEKRALLQAMLPHVPFDGWTDKALARAAADTGADPMLVRRAFPGGAGDAVSFHIEDADRRMVEGLQDMDLEALKVRERIAAAIRLRLEQNADHKEAIRRALAYEALPFRAAGATQRLYGTVDAIWRAIGDRSTDFSFYTKRALLTGVYSSTLLYWLGDRSEGHEKTLAFLDRRIADVMNIQKARGRLESMLPDPSRLLRVFSHRSGGMRRADGR